MKNRVTLALATSLGLAAFLGGCYQPAPAAKKDKATLDVGDLPDDVTGPSPHSTNGTKTTPTGTTTGTSTTTAPTTPPEVPDAGPPAPAFDAFKGAPAFAQTGTQGLESRDHHGGYSKAGANCFDCHDGSNTAAPRFAFGGTIYNTGTAGGTAVKGAQVRVVTATGDEIAMVSTDSSGNFWLESQAVTVPTTARVAVRTATAVKTMSAGTALSTGGCGATGCHVANRPAFVQ